MRSPRAVRGGQRYIDLPEEAVALLLEIGKTRRGELIFAGRKPDQPMTGLYPYWNKLRKELGVPEMKLEDLRYNGKND